MSVSEAEVVANLRADWKETIEGDGGVCPCCDRWGKVNQKRIHRAMANDLLWLYQESLKHPIGTWIDVPATAPKSVLRSNNIGSLRHWGLVEGKTHDDSDRKQSGVYRITLKGRDFVDGLIVVPSRMFYYNGAPVGFSTDLVKFKDCLGAAFDYRAMMADTFAANDVKLVGVAA